MEDCNTTLMALEIAASRLNLYIVFSILASVISVVAIIISFFVAKKQLEANHEWNRRQAALTEMFKNRESASNAVVALNSSINYREQKDAYSLKDIHKALCDNENHEENPMLTENGKIIKHNIFIILNYYEYLAIGIENKVFDEDVIKDSVKGAVIKAQKLFGEYIEHLRSEKHTGNKKLFISLQNLSKKWKDEDSEKLPPKKKTA